MKRIIIILIILTFLRSEAYGQVNDNSFSFYYSFTGLGCNIGSMQPTIKISGTNLTFTYEQNSYYVKKTKSPDTISVTTIRQSSIDSILTLVNDLKDTTIHETNLCTMSGGIHIMTISSKEDTTSFTLHNTFHRTALKISEIVNQYLPEDKKIWAKEQDIIDCENCWSAMWKSLEKEKK
jgi:hypothetical protein